MSYIGLPYKANPDVNSQKVNYSSQSVISQTAFGPQTKVVRIVASTDCYVAFDSSNVVASQATSMFIRANWTPDYFLVSPGQYVAAIRDSADGTLYITEMTR